MKIAATYSLNEETVATIKRIAKQTYRSQSSVVDMAVALLAAQVFAEDGSIDLPTPPAKPLRKKRKSTGPLSAITGVHKGLKQQMIIEVI